MGDRNVPLALDLFAGAGGLSQGLRQAGFTPVFANEIDPVYADTYRANHPGTKMWTEDIRALDAAEVREKLRLEQGELQLLAGGPPCQGFSINAPVRSTDDDRNHLFLDYCRFVAEFLPSAVLIENVPGLVSFEAGSTLHNITSAVASLGYDVAVKVLYAPHYGVPQTRWRTIIIGLREGQASGAFPEPTHTAPHRLNFTSHHMGVRLIQDAPSKRARPCPTVRDAIGDLPSLGNGGKTTPGAAYPMPPSNPYQREMRRRSDGVFNHEAQALRSVNLERLRHIPPGGSWRDIPHHLLPEGMKRARSSDHTKRYGRAHPDALSCTILTKCDPHWGAYFHYEQDRAFTVREAARLQSFPDNFVFSGSRVSQYEQVGNAVPPRLAAAIGRSIGSALALGADQSSQAGA